MRAELLHIILPYSNHERWTSRLANFRRCEEHLRQSGAQIHTIELQYGNRHWDLPDTEGIHRIRVRGNDVLWHKENLGNIAETHLPADAEYIGIFDADLLFHDHEWAAE